MLENNMEGRAKYKDVTTKQKGGKMHQKVVQIVLPEETSEGETTEWVNRNGLLNSIFSI